jgi:hypothetical protein
MGERERRREGTTETPQRDGDEAERSLGRAVAIGLPSLCIVGAFAAGILGSVGSALLVLASGAMLATIALLWASLRTLSGDAPLPVDLDPISGRHHDVDERGERKRRVLRALKDLETERALGKIDAADYDVIAARYREDAKALMRDMDQQTAPARAEAEKLASEYLSQRRKRGAGVPSPRTAPDAGRRMACAGCGVSNDSDATFCKRCGSPLKASSDGDDAGA